MKYYYNIKKIKPLVWEFKSYGGKIERYLETKKQQNLRCRIKRYNGRNDFKFQITDRSSILTHYWVFNTDYNLYISFINDNFKNIVENLLQRTYNGSWLDNSIIEAEIEKLFVEYKKKNYE